MNFAQLSDSKVQSLVDYYQVQRRPHETAQVNECTITYMRYHCIFHAKTVISIFIDTLYTQNRERCIVSMNMTRPGDLGVTDSRAGTQQDLEWAS